LLCNRNALTYSLTFTSSGAEIDLAWGPRSADELTSSEEHIEVIEDIRKYSDIMTRDRLDV